MSKVANYVLGVSGAIVVGIWAIASLGEENANGVPQAAAPVIPESVAAPAVEVNLETPVAKSTEKLASAYPIESCKAAIALIMDRDPKTMQGRKLGDGQVHVSYRRPDDGKKWEARCEMVDDSHLQWAAFNAFGDGQMGRWRTEDRIEIKVSDGKLQVDIDQSGVIKKNESFSLKSLS